MRLHLPALPLIILVACGPAVPISDGVDREEHRYQAVVDDRTITLYMKDDTAGGKVYRMVTLEDPREDTPISTRITISNRDSIRAEFNSQSGATEPAQLIGVRGADGTWQLSYGRPGTVPDPIAFAEHPLPIQLERKEYHGSGQVAEPTSDEVVANGEGNGQASLSVYTYRITDRNTGQPHPLDAFLQDFICNGKTYEQFTTVTGEDWGSTTYSASIPHKSEDRVVIRVEQSYYEEGMAHDQMGSRLINYDLTSNREMKLADVVPVKNHGQLKAMAKKRFYTKYTAEDMPNKTFTFTKNVGFMHNGIEFLYQPYEMGPFVAGYMSVTLPYSEIMHLMDPNSGLFKALTRKK